MTKTSTKTRSALLGLLLTGTLLAQSTTRVKDVATLTGLEDLQLYGYGLVVGLAGTGDKSQTVFTTQTVVNMLKNMGIEVPDKYMRVRNVAAVIVTGTLSPFKKRGTRLDVTVSSLGDATSLEGGTLVLTAMQGPDGVSYSSAQGPLATGGYDVNNDNLSRVKKNHVLFGRIPDGAIVQREYQMNPVNAKELSLSLSTPDFTSALSMAQAINEAYKDKVKGPVAQAIDAATVLLSYEAFFRDTIRNRQSLFDIIEFISGVENVQFSVSNRARVVVNERTGTIVAGGNVTISQVAVTHGGVKVEIVNTPEVVQPAPFSQGQSTIIPNPQMVVEEKNVDMVVLPSTTTVSDLAQSLNSLGVSPRDVIAIFQAIKEAGALQGQLVIM